MSKLNQPGKDTTTDIIAVAARHNQQLAFSANGNLQFVKEPLQMLYELTVSTLFGKGTFYKSSDQLVQELRANVIKVVNLGAVDPAAYDFIANLAIHARTEMNIRTIPIVLVVEFAKALSDKRQAATNPAEKYKYSYDHMRELVRDVIQRADQITDLYAYALTVFGDKGKIPMAIKRGVADAFNKFGEYNFAKYNRHDAVKFRDVLRIVHPVAKSVDQGLIFEKIMKDNLATPYTWEVELSKNGQLPPHEQKSKNQLWTELVTSGKMGYMATLRNLRNMVEANLDTTVIKSVCDYISDPHNVAMSRQLPFDFIEAYNVIKPLDAKLATAVSKAIDIAAGNIPSIGKNVWVIIDYSGSMGCDYSESNCYGYNLSNSMPAVTTATLLAAALIKANSEDSDNLAITLFGSAAKTINGVDTNNSILAIKKELLSYRVGNIRGSTNFGAALQERSNLNFEPDTVIVVTDNEVNKFPYDYIVNAINKNAVKITINLNASSTTPMSCENGWYALAGWSTAMFRWIPAIRNKSSVVDELSRPYIGVHQQ